MVSPQATVRQASQEDSALSQAESAVSQAGNPQASLEDSALSQAEITVSQAGNPKASLEDSALSQAESEVSQLGNAQAAPVIRLSVRLRASHASQVGSPQAGNSPGIQCYVSQIGRPPSWVLPRLVFPR